MRGSCPVHSDCQDAVSEWQDPRRATSARATWVGLWRQIYALASRPDNRIMEVVKRQARLAEDRCSGPAARRSWLGNAAADAAIGGAAAAVVPSTLEVAAYEADYRLAVAVAAAAASVLAVWPPA